MNGMTDEALRLLDEHAKSVVFPQDFPLVDGATGHMYGLTKRELFAGMATIGIIAADCNAKDTYRDVADKARDQADALIASLQAQP